MTRQEFKDFCHEEFIKRGFKKKKSVYYLHGKDLLCGLYLQKSMSDAYYVEYDFFLGNFPDIKKYPTIYDADISRRFTVLSKDTYEGEFFMDACIEYELYTEDEVKKYFDEEFKRYIMPIIEGGKERLIQDLDYFLDEMFEEEIQKVLNKLGIDWDHW